MKLNYKLGELIRNIDVKNKDLHCNNLKGLSMTKEFRASTSNIVGTDLSKYKIVAYKQFACDFMSAIRVHKMPIALNSEMEEILVSPAYAVFEVIDENIILPEYLMMWFRRSEFDRYADFRSDAAIRGGYGWNELCETEIKLPSLEEQRKKVQAYKTITDRIELKKKINDNLEATAFAIYRETFITSRSANWNKGTLSDLLAVKYGKDHKHLADGTIPLYGSGGIMRYVEKSLYDKVSVLIPRKGTLSNVLYVDEPFWSVDTMFYTEISKPYAAKFIYYFVKSKDLAGMDTGSAVPSMSSEIIHSMELDIPDDETLISFDKCLCPLYKQIKINNQECDKLKSLQGILLTTISSR